jgi:hypothetical protein
MKINLLVFVFTGVLLCVVEMQAQLNGEMSASIPIESSKINTEPDKSLLIVHSQVQNLQFDSNRKIDKLDKVSSGEWRVWLPPGTHILKILCKDYQSIELGVFNFGKKKVYELSVKEVRAPRLGLSMGGKGDLFVSSEPEGAELTIDGIPGKWKTPTTIPEIKATIWDIKLILPRYDTLFTKVTVFQDSLVRLERLKLSPRFGFLRIDAENDVLFFLNGIKQNFKKNESVEVPIGPQRITLKKTKYADFDTTLNVNSGMIYELRAKFVPQFGFLRFEDFQRLIVFVDGKQIALDTNIELSLGTHSVRMSNKQYGVTKRSYILSPGEVKVIRLTDFLESGFLNLSTDMPADIYVDGKFVGKDTARFEAMPGEHTVKYVHPSLGEVSELVDIQATKVKDVFIPMLPSRSTALWRCLIPGSSQLYTNQTARGYLYFGAFLASAAASIYFYKDYTTRKTDYDAAVNNYKSAVTADKIALYRNQILSQYDKLDQARKSRDLGLISTAAIYAVNILDRLIFPPEYGYRQREPNISMEIRSNPNLDGVQVTWKVPQ